MQKLLALLLLAPLAVPPAWGQVAYSFVTGGGSYLGVGIRDVASEDVGKLGLPHERGVYITDVQEGSPAGEAGIQEADVILEYSGIPVLSARQFQGMVADTPRGRPGGKAASTPSGCTFSMQPDKQAIPTFFRA